jgi:phosphate transport system protein
MTMFKSIRDLFSSDNWSQATASRVGEMLDLCSSMYSFALGVVLEDRDAGPAQSKIYDRDKRINLLECEVRRSVVTHLALEHNRNDMPSALIFMNVVKDAERVGDYIKNLYDVARDILPDNYDHAVFETYLGANARSIDSMLIRTSKAFRLSDEEEAHKIIDEARQVGLSVEQTIIDITKSDLPNDIAIALALTLRFLKRIAGHMSNIASSVVMPVDLMDFFDEP